MIVELLTEHHLEFLSLKGGCGCSSESTHVKMPHCWKSYATAQFVLQGRPFREDKKAISHDMASLTLGMH